MLNLLICWIPTLDSVWILWMCLCKNLSLGDSCICLYAIQCKMCPKLYGFQRSHPHQIQVAMLMVTADHHMLLHQRREHILSAPVTNEGRLVQEPLQFCLHPWWRCYNNTWRNICGDEKSRGGAELSEEITMCWRCCLRMKHSHLRSFQSALNKQRNFRQLLPFLNSKTTLQTDQESWLALQKTVLLLLVAPKIKTRNTENTKTRL